MIPPGVCVVKQGESGDKFYVVQEGTFDVVLNGVVTSVAGRGSSIGPGQSFGELALIHDGPRHATLRVPKTQAGKGSVVYSLTREGFRHIVARQQAAKVTQVKETLRKVKLLEGLSDTELSTVAASVKLVDFAPGTMVIRKGEPGLEMYIIKEGDVVCEVPGASVDSTSSPESRPRSGSVVATKVSNHTLSSPLLEEKGVECIYFYLLFLLRLRCHSVLGHGLVSELYSSTT